MDGGIYFHPLFAALAYDEKAQSNKKNYLI
jgi:hypothetical protein